MQNPENPCLQGQFPQTILPLIHSYTILSLRDFLIWQIHWICLLGTWGDLEIQRSRTNIATKFSRYLSSSNTAVLFIYYLIRIYFHSFSKRTLDICNLEHSLLQIVWRHLDKTSRFICDRERSFFLAVLDTVIPIKTCTWRSFIAANCCHCLT